MAVCNKVVLAVILAVVRIPEVATQVTTKQVSITLTFDSTPGPLIPTPFTIDLGAMGVAPQVGQEENTPFVTFAANERIWIHLPGFAGGWNDLMGSITTFASDGSELQNAFMSAEWDPQNELLRFVVASDIAAGGLRTMQVGTRTMFLAINEAVPSGLGPLPPRGGMASEWVHFAWVRRFVNTACGGDLEGGIDVCSSTRTSGTTVLEYVFDSTTQTFSTEFGHIPTHLGGATGTVAHPDFVYAAAGDSADTHDLPNCITVTFVSSLTFKSKLDEQVFITISGLAQESKRNADDFEMPVYEDEEQCQRADGRGRQLSRFDERIFLAVHGTLTLRMAAQSYLVAGEVNVLTFKLNNPALNQASQKLSISASGDACVSSYKCEDSDSEARAIAPREMASGAILESRAPHFRVKQIFQQRSGPDQDTVIFVTLRPSVAIAGTDAITIAGLCGTDFNGEVLPLVRTAGSNAQYRGSRQGSPLDGLVAAPAEQTWRRDQGELLILPNTAGFRQGELYAFGWVWRTRSGASPPCPSITISVGSEIEQEEMDNVGESVGRTLAPRFTTVRVGQASTRPGADNYICVTLTPNAEFRSQADADGEFIRGVVTLSGLRGTATASAASAPIVRCPNGLNDDGELTVDGVPYSANVASAAFSTWNTLPNSGGARVFRVPTETAASNDFEFNADSGVATVTLENAFVMRRGVEYVFSLRLRNGERMQGCQEVGVRASSSTFREGLAAAGQPVSGRALQDGQEDGDGCVLRTTRPQFIVRSVAQLTPLAGEPNTITVSLRPNVPLQSTVDFTAMFSLSGLDGVGTSVQALVQQDVPGQFAPLLSRLDFDQGTGTVRARLSPGSCKTPMLNNRANNVCMLPGFTYVFRFALVNPDRSQPAPTVRVEASWRAGEAMPRETVHAPPDDLSRPLRLIPAADVIRTARIGQTAPHPDARNALCVTLASWAGWSVGPVAAFPSVTIAGLRGLFASPSGDLPIWHPETAGEFGNVPLSSSPSVPGAALRNREPANMIGTVPWTTRADSKVTFSRSRGHVTFALNHVRAGRELSFCFLLANGPDEQPGPCDGVTLDVTVPGRGASSYTMDQDATKSLAGAGPGSACVGRTVARGFAHATLRGSSNVTGTQSVMRLELLPTAVVTSGYVVTVTGLQGVGPVGGATGRAERVPVHVTRNGRRDEATLAENAELTAEGELRLTLRTPGNMPSRDSAALRFCSVVPATVAAWRASCGSPPAPAYFTVTFTLQNGDAPVEARRVTVTAAPPPTAVLSPAFPPTFVDTGLRLGPVRRQWHRRTLSGRRAGHGELALTMVTTTHLYGGETLVLDLPHHGMDTTGEVFGVVSTGADAFTTWDSAEALRDSAVPGAAARAFFTPGHVADGVTEGRSSGPTGPGLDGFLLLADDDAGRREDKSGWHVPTDALWSGTYTQRVNAVVSTAEGGTTRARGAGPYPWNQNMHTLSFPLTDDDGESLSRGQIEAEPRYRVFTDGNSVVGMEVRCQVEGPDRARMVLAQSLVEVGDRFEVALFVERGFLTPAGALVPELSCELKWKQRVGRYTGMRGMVSQTDVTFKQGAGPLYFVSDHSGMAPRYSDLSGQPYTVFSRLEIVARRDADVPPGTEITIRVPNVLFPASMEAGLTADSDESVASRVTLSLALLSPLAGATSLRDGNVTGTPRFQFELPELRPYVGASPYNGELLQSLRGRFVDFFGAMSLEASGTVGAVREREVPDAEYQPGNSSHWNSILLAPDNALFPSARTESWAGAPVLLGMASSAATPSRSLQLRIAADVRAPGADGAQEVRFRGWQERVPSPDERREGRERWDRDSLEPLALPGRHYADGEFETHAAAAEAAGVDLIGAGSAVHVIGEVGNMIGMDGADAVLLGDLRLAGGHAIPPTAVGRPPTNWVPAADTARDASFLFQAPKLISSPVETAGGEPRVTYATEAGPVLTMPPQQLSANIRVMLALQPPIPLPEEKLPLDCATQAGRDVVVLGDATSVNLDELNIAHPCGLHLDTPTFNLRHRTGTLRRLAIVPVSAASAALFASGVSPDDIASDIVRLDGTPDLAVALSFLFKRPARRLLQACGEGTEFRVVQVGEARDSTCDQCPASCPGPAECTVGPGDWVVAELPVSVCAPGEEGGESDRTGAIVGGVVGGTLAALLLLLLCCPLSRPELETVTARELPAEKPLVPVFIPDHTAILELDVQPNPAPLPGPDFVPLSQPPMQNPLSAVSLPRAAYPPVQIDDGTVTVWEPSQVSTGHFGPPLETV